MKSSTSRENYDSRAWWILALGSDERKTILNLVLTSLVFISNFCCRSLTSNKLAQDTSEMIIWQQRLKLRKPEKNSGTDFWIPDAQNLYAVEYSGDLKSDLELKTLPRSDFKWYGFRRVSIIWKPDHSKSGHVCPDLKWFFTKWRPFVQI